MNKFLAEVRTLLNTSTLYFKWFTFPTVYKRLSNQTAKTQKNKNFKKHWEYSNFQTNGGLWAYITCTGQWFVGLLLGLTMCTTAGGGEDLDSQLHLEFRTKCQCGCCALQDLLYRRSRALVDYENANKALDKARAKNKDVLQAETSQQLCCQKFERISESAKQGTVNAFQCKVCFVMALL